MRNLTPQPNTARRGSAAGITAPSLAGANQSRYKGLISTPGITKFSAWKRENEIPRLLFHQFVLQKMEEQKPDKLWMKDCSSGRAETFGKVKKVVANIASGLTKIGFKQADVICMYCPNYVDYWLVCLAAWSCGGCVMPVNCDLELDDFRKQISDGKPKIIVCDDLNLDDALAVAAAVTPKVEHIIAIGTERKEKPNIIPISDLLSDDGKTTPGKFNAEWETDVIYLPFTSTSGQPMGMMHTHKSLVSSFYSPPGATNHWFDQVIGESVACGNWFFHMTGLYSIVLAASYGLTLYTLSDYSDSGFLDMIFENKIASAAVYPWQIRMLSQSPEISKYDLSCLKILLTGGSLLSTMIRYEVFERLPSLRYVREGYGLNECGMACLTYPREKKNSITSIKSLDTPNDHIMPVGLPNMYSQVKIVSRQMGEPVQGPDQQGEICVKAPQTFIGYLNHPELNQKKFDSDGFFHTGDLGYYDNQGVVYFIETISNLIHFWMYEVSPSVLESRLLASNNIVDAAVVGIPDKENGEVPRAFVVLRPGFEETEENLINLMESRLEDHERIRGGLIFIHAIPRDENWKVRKDLLKAYTPKLSQEIHEVEISKETVNLGASGNATASATSPKVARKGVQELVKMPNGSFVASEPQFPSPRVRRSGVAKAACVQDHGPKQSQMGSIPEGKGNLDLPEDSDRRSVSPRRASVDSKKLSIAASRLSTSAYGSVGVGGTCSSRSSSRRGSIAEPKDPRPVRATPSDKALKYWMQVTWEPEDFKDLLLSHPAVMDCAIRGFKVDGIGDLPRAFVVLKSGYTITAEELLLFLDSKMLGESMKLRGGVVFVDKLAKDQDGKLFVSLDKYNEDAVGVDHDFIRHQPKVKTTSP